MSGFISDEEMEALEARERGSKPQQPSGFVSDADMARMGQGSGDDARPDVSSRPGGGDAFLRGAAQGATLGMADEITAGVGSLYDYLSAKAGLRGDISLGDAYRTRRDSIRRADDRAEAENPLTFAAGGLVGGAASAFAPGGAALNAAKGARLSTVAGKGATAGGLAGAGSSRAELTGGDADYGGLAGDVAVGGLVGAGIGTGLRGIAAGAKALGPSNLAKKVGNVAFNVPEEVTETYLQNPAAVKGAMPRWELAKKFQDEGVDRLRDEVVGGSVASRQILADEGQKISGSQIASIMKGRAEELARRSEGIWDDPHQFAAYKWLTETAEKFAPDPATPGVDRQLSTNRVKDMLQTIDRMTDWDSGGGRISRIDDTVRKGVRHDIDQLLKSTSPAYAAQMQRVAPDAALLSEVQDVATSPGRLANAFRRMETDQYGAGQLPREAIEALDKRLGTDFAHQAKLSVAKETFDKSVMSGSRNVNLYNNTLGKIPVVGPLAGPLFGGVVDKYGGKLAVSGVDMASRLNQVAKRDGVRAFTEGLRELVGLAGAGSAPARLAIRLLEKTNPEAERIIRSMTDQQAYPGGAAE